MRIGWVSIPKGPIGPLVPLANGFYRVAMALLLAAGVAQAKSLEDRVGFGMSYFHFENTAALSLRYFPSNYLSADFLFGFNTASSNKTTTLGIKLSRNLNLEENMNFFAALAGYVLSTKEAVTGNQNTGVEFNTLLGAEFFLPGIPHLGLMLEAGLALQSTQNVIFESVASASAHYYF